MDMESLKLNGQKRRILSSFIALLIFFISLNWYRVKISKWHHVSLFACRSESPSKASLLHQLKEVKIQRMLYEKPNALKPPRTDILMMTPWFAPIVWNDTYNSDILNAQFSQREVRIGLTVFAIKKYTVFLKTFLETAEKFFMAGYKVKFYIFTDQPEDVRQLNLTFNEGRSMVILEVPGYKRWQDVSMRHMEMIHNQTYEKFINEVDYIVCVDVDMIFKEDVGLEILSDLIGTLHFSFYGLSRKEFTYERRPESEACIPTDEGDFYYAGGFFGGTVEEVYKLTNFCHNAMIADKAKNIEALWHDESYLNKYFLYHKPTKVLSPEYLWHSLYGFPKKVKRPKFLAIIKNDKVVRN